MFSGWVRLILTSALQKAPDCDMILVHDHDLEKIGGIGVGTVSKHLVVHLVSNYIVFMSAVVENLSARLGDGPSREVQHRYT